MIWNPWREIRRLRAEVQWWKEQEERMRLCEANTYQMYLGEKQRCEFLSRLADRLSKGPR